MDNTTNKQATAVVYEPPTLVALGKFSTDTQGMGTELCRDSTCYYAG
jgi:hypothetical protein